MANSDSDAEALVQRLQQRQHGLITRQQALKSGLTADAVRWRSNRGVWQRVHTGVYRLAGTPQAREQEILAACLAVGGVASHRAAAYLLGLPNVPYALDVTVFNGGAAAHGAALHRSGPLGRADKNWVRGVPVTSVSRTVIDLAGVLPKYELEALVDYLLATRRMKLKFLMNQVQARGIKARRGARVLMDILQARVGAVAVDSEPQRELARLLNAFGLPPGVHEYEIVLPDGRRRRVDRGWPEILVGCQIDSYRHHSTLADHTNDVVRDDDAGAEGWRILRVTPEQLRNDPSMVAALIARTLGVEPTIKGAACR